MLKILLLLISVSAFGYSTKPGPMTIGDTKHKPDASAVLDLFTTTLGFLPPRLDTLQRDAILSPATGLEIYNTDRNTPEFFNGTAWIQSGGTGTSFQVMQAAHGRALGCPLTPVYWNGTAWTDASADATSTLGTHVITKVIDVDTFEVSQSGKFECAGHGLTPALHYYVEVGGGLRTTPAPVFNNPVLLVEDANTVHVMPYRASSTVATTVGQVDTVFGRAGNVVAENGDYNATQVTFTPTGALTTNTVQAALAELDLIVSSQDPSGKADNSIQIIAGSGLSGGGDLTANRTLDLDLGFPGDIVEDTDTIIFLDGSDSDNPKTASVDDILALKTSTLDDLTDVDTTGFLAGQVLEFDGTNFVAGFKTMGTDSQTATQVPFSPDGDLTSTDVQAALVELRDDTDAKVSAVVQPARQVLAGTGLSGGGDLSSDVTLNVDPANVDITALQNFSPNSFIDMSTVNIDVTDMNDGILAINPTLDSDVVLRIDIPSLDRENPVLTNTDFLAYSLSAGKLVKASAADIADAAAAAVVAPVTTVNSEIGDVVLTSDDIDDAGQTNKWATQAELDNIATNTAQVPLNTSQISTNVTDISNTVSATAVNTASITSNDTDIATNATNISTNTAALAGLATVATSGDYNDLLNLPTLGTAADNAETDFATSAQGVLADSATQPGDNVSTLTNDAGYITGAAIPVSSVNTQTGTVVLDADDIDDTSTTHKFATAAELTQIATNQTNIAALDDVAITGNAAQLTYDSTFPTGFTGVVNLVSTAIGQLDARGIDSDVNIASNDTDIATNVTNIASNDTDIATNVTNIASNDTDIATNVTNIATNTSAISSLATVASTGDYTDLLNLPTLGTAAAEDIGFFATSAQGLLADTATQPGDNISTLTNDAGYITAATAPVTSINALTGTVVLDADDIDDTATAHKFATDTQLTQIATNATDITTNATDIAANSTSISTNATNISNNGSAAATNALAIAANTTDITANADDIVIINADIASNTTAIATNATNISSNDTDIATNVTNITSNDTDIAANVTSINELQANQNDLVSLSGLPENSTDLGTFTGDTIVDAIDVKTALQQLEVAVEERVAISSNTNTNTNINNAGLFTNTLPLFGTNSLINDDGSFTFGTNQVTVNFTGFVEIDVSMHVTSAGQRNAIQLRTKLNGTPIGPIGSTGYIRVTAGHAESSLHIHGYYLPVTTGDIITFGSFREGTNGTATFLDQAGSSNVTIRRVVQ